MRCRECGAPVVTYADNGETACADDASHDVEETEDSPWFINSDGEADWALAKVKRSRWELARIKEMVDFEVARIVERGKQLSRTHERDEQYFTAHLEDYMRRLQEKGQAQKTYRLVNGDLSVRAGSTVVEVVDEALALDFAEGNGRVELLNIKTSPNKPAIKKALQSGEEIPGVLLVTKPPTFSVLLDSAEPSAVLPMPRDEEAA